MRKLTYLAVFEPTATGYSVYFPDLPGCISTGTDFEDAREQARDALGLHIYGMEKDGEDLPTPSKNPSLDPDTAPGSMVSPVSVLPSVIRNELDNRAVKTNLTIPAWLKEIAEERGVNYSKVFQAALMEYLNIDELPPEESHRRP